jgi:hypothetical protein
VGAAFVALADGEAGRVCAGAGAVGGAGWAAVETAGVTVAGMKGLVTRLHDRAKRTSTTAVIRLKFIPDFSLMDSLKLTISPNSLRIADDPAWLAKGTA